MTYRISSYLHFLLSCWRCYCFSSPGGDTRRQLHAHTSRIQKVHTDCHLWPYHSTEDMILAWGNAMASLKITTVYTSHRLILTLIEYILTFHSHTVIVH